MSRVGGSVSQRYTIARGLFYPRQSQTIGSPSPKFATTLATNLENHPHSRTIELPNSRTPERCASPHRINKDWRRSVNVSCYYSGARPLRVGTWRNWPQPIPPARLVVYPPRNASAEKKFLGWTRARGCRTISAWQASWSCRGGGSPGKTSTGFAVCWCRIPAGTARA